METNELKATIEALLFVAGEPLPLKRLHAVLEGVEKPRIQEALSELSKSYNSDDHGLQLIQIANGYQFLTKSTFAPFLKRLEKIKSPNKLSKSGLESLAIIAYKQPVTRGELEAIRGVDSASAIRTMLERRIIRIVGRREGLGRPMLYGTTPEFLHYFGLKDLSELPALKDFKEISDIPSSYDPISESVNESIN